MIVGDGRLNSFLILDKFYQRLKDPIENKKEVVVENFDALPSFYPDAQIIICLFINSFNVPNYQRNNVEIDANCSCNCYAITGTDESAGLNSREASELLAQRFITYCFNNICNADNLDSMKLGEDKITEFKPSSILKFDMADKIEALQNIVAYQFNFAFKTVNQIPVHLGTGANINNFEIREIHRSKE